MEERSKLIKRKNKDDYIKKRNKNYEEDEDDYTIKNENIIEENNKIENEEEKEEEEKEEEKKEEEKKEIDEEQNQKYFLKLIFFNKKNTIKLLSAILFNRYNPK
jgi:hypothetical protein